MLLVNEPGEECTVSNGVLRLSATPTPIQYAGFMVLPLGTNSQVRDLYASVDILDWVTSSSNWVYFALGGRGVYHPQTDSANGYIGGLVMNGDSIPGNVKLSVWDGSADVRGPNFDTAVHPPPYRLEFSVVGNNLRLRVLNLATRALIAEQPLVRASFTQGWVGCWINRRNSAGDSFTITLDNFFMSGTK